MAKQTKALAPVFTTPVKTPKAHLQRMLKFLTKKRWAKGALAYGLPYDEHSTPDAVPVHSNKAATFCLLGASGRVKDGTHKSIQTKAEAILAGVIDPDTRKTTTGRIIGFNDDDAGSITDIHRVFRAAIKAAK